MKTNQSSWYTSAAFLLKKHFAVPTDLVKCFGLEEIHNSVWVAAPSCISLKRGSIKTDICIWSSFNCWAEKTNVDEQVAQKKFRSVSAIINSMCLDRMRSWSGRKIWIKLLLEQTEVFRSYRMNKEQKHKSPLPEKKSENQMTCAQLHLGNKILIWAAKSVLKGILEH